jgi:hypothetical protein
MPRSSGSRASAPANWAARSAYPRAASSLAWFGQGAQHEICVAQGPGQQQTLPQISLGLLVPSILGGDVAEVDEGVGQRAADRRHGGGVLAGQDELPAHRARSVHEELHRRGAGRLFH